jgi:predicted ABC-type ATPase
MGLLVRDLEGVESIEEIIPDVTSIVPYPYRTIRSEKYDRLIDSFMDTSGARSEVSPLIFHMGGIPGSGKTTYYRNNRDNFRDYILIAFDHIMESIDDYKIDNVSLGSVKSLEKWMLVARVMGYELLLRSLKRRLNIFFDHGGLFDSHVSLMKNLRDYGYRTKMCFIRCDPEVAYRRTQEREKVTHRHTPREMIEQRYAKAAGYLNAYREVVDDLVIIDS